MFTTIIQSRTLFFDSNAKTKVWVNVARTNYIKPPPIEETKFKQAPIEDFYVITRSGDYALEIRGDIGEPLFAVGKGTVYVIDDDWLGYNAEDTGGALLSIHYIFGKVRYIVVYCGIDLSTSEELFVGDRVMEGQTIGHIPDPDIITYNNHLGPHFSFRILKSQWSDAQGSWTSPEPEDPVKMFDTSKVTITGNIAW